MQIAVLGMGRMGRALAGRLLGGGHRVTVWNRTAGRAAEVVAAGAVEHRTVPEAVAGADAVITMLANDDAVSTVALGPLRDAMGPETIYADCSTVSPQTAAELSEAFPGRFVALPVIGGPASVAAGTAVLLAGGDPAVLDRLAPAVASLSGAVRRYDTPSLALTAKLTTNLLLLSEIVALAESFAVGRAGGLRDDQLRDLLGTSPLVGSGLRNRFEDVLTGSQEGWWSTMLGAKDAGLAIDVARQADIDLPAARAVRNQYDQAGAAGWSDADIAAVTELYRRQLTGQR